MDRVESNVHMILVISASPGMTYGEADSTAFVGRFLSAEESYARFWDLCAEVRWEERLATYAKKNPD